MLVDMNVVRVMAAYAAITLTTLILTITITTKTIIIIIIIIIIIQHNSFNMDANIPGNLTLQQFRKIIPSL